MRLSSNKRQGQNCSVAGGKNVAIYIYFSEVQHLCLYLLKVKGEPENNNKNLRGSFPILLFPTIPFLAKLFKLV
jgi:hypothetical protein